MRIDVEFEPVTGGEPVPAHVRFGDRRLRVTAVLDRWHGREHTWWKLETGDGACILRQDERTRAWSIVAVPNDRGTPSPPMPRVPDGTRH